MFWEPDREHLERFWSYPPRSTFNERSNFADADFGAESIESIVDHCHSSYNETGSLRRKIASLEIVVHSLPVRKIPKMIQWYPSHWFDNLSL